MTLAVRIVERRAKVAVVGLGYVGLPLALRAAEAGFVVTGFDTDQNCVDELANGRSSILDVDGAEIAAQYRSGRFRAVTDPAELSSADVIVICVPTPLKDEQPDTSFIEAAAASVAKTLRPPR